MQCFVIFGVIDNESVKKSINKISQCAGKRDSILQHNIEIALDIEIALGVTESMEIVKKGLILFLRCCEMHEITYI